MRLPERIIQKFDYETIEVLKEYVDEQVAILSKLLATEKDINVMRQHQGAIAALHKLTKIRENAVATVNFKES